MQRVSPSSALAQPGGLWLTVATWAVLASVLVSCLVFARRGLEAANAAVIAPGVAVTSGFEEESLFTLWRAVHDQPVYLDPVRQPYAAAYFNWLFYRSYAALIGPLVGRTSDAIIPAGGRLVTAGFALLGVAALGSLLWRVLAGQAAIANGLAAFVWFGPLVGWWAHTVRPDVGALALETAALAVLLQLYRSRPLAAVVASGLLFYCAWSFKQSYIFGLGTALLFLVFRRQWRPAALLGGVSLGLWVATFARLGSAYQSAIQGTVVDNTYYFALGFTNLCDMLVKASPLVLLVGAGLFLRRPETAADNHPLAIDACLLGRLGLLVAMPLGFAASCKLGAVSYYYFTTTVMLSILAASLIARVGNSRLIVAGFGMAAGLQTLVFFGYAGKIDLSDQTRKLAATWAVWQRQPEPRFSSLTSLNLPWLNSNSLPLVLSFNYGRDRAAGRPFERDGLGGLIATGYFRTLLLPADTGAAYDGGSLQSYTRGEAINGLTIFHRQRSP